MPSNRDRVRTMRTVLGHGMALCALLGGLALAPQTALASRLASDRIAGIPLSSGAIAPTKAPDISARAGQVVASGGPVLWARRADTSRRMASTTKVMTALLVLEHCSLDEVVTVTKTAARTPYATGLKAGERRSVRKLLELALVSSSNDAATALAIHVAGSVKDFALLMNARASELGLAHTHYVNPHGLDQKGQYSSAADLTRLMRTAIKQPEFKRILRLRSVRLPAYKKRRARTIRATDKLLGEVTGLRGGKTGFTNDARYCFVASARRDGVTLTSVVLGAPSSYSRFKSSKTLLEWGFKHYRIKQVASVDSTVGVVPISNATSQSVTVKYAETTSTAVFGLLPLTRTSTLPSSISAPVAKGQVLGVVTIAQNGSVLTTVAAVAAEAVEAPGPIDQAAAWITNAVASIR